MDEKAKSIDEKIQRQLDEIEISRSSDGATLDGSLTRLDKDELFYKVIILLNLFYCMLTLKFHFMLYKY